MHYIVCSQTLVCLTGQSNKNYHTVKNFGRRKLGEFGELQ